MIWISLGSAFHFCAPLRQDTRSSCEKGDEIGNLHVSGIVHQMYSIGLIHTHHMGGEWYLEKRGSRKIFAGSGNLGSIFDESRSLVFHGLLFLFLSLETFHQRVSGSDF